MYARLLPVALLSLTACGRSHDGDPRSLPVARHFSWSESLASDAVVYVRTMNGAVRVIEGTGSVALVKAEVRGHGSRARAVRFETHRVGNDVVICAMWTEGGQCNARDYKTKLEMKMSFFGRRGSTPRADFTIELPAGTRVDAVAMNGDVVVDAVRSPVEARTVNGDVRIGTAVGPVRARTVNGDVQVRVASLGTTGGVELETVNGDVEAELPAALDGDLRLKTVNGALEVGYPVQVGPGSRKRIAATVGKGGRPIVMETVNGDVTLRKLGG